MSRKSKQKLASQPKRKPASIKLTPVIYLSAFLGVIVTICIAYKAYTSDHHLLSVGLLALFAGLLIESFRISDNWKTVAAIFFSTYLFSLLSFFPGKKEHVYNFEDHIRTWPYVFIILFCIVLGLWYKDKVTARLTEGVTLLQSLSLIYWTIDYGFTNYTHWFPITLLVIAFSFSAYSIIHALTNLHLSTTARLILSIWSTVIMFAFAVDNIYRVFSSPDMDSATFISDWLYIGLQYFLLGVSSVYIVQDFFMLVSFFPSKNGDYKKELAEIRRDHLARYSAEQVFPLFSVLCIAYAGMVYVLNYKYQFLPRHTMIWLVFFTFPLIVLLINATTNKNKPTAKNR